MLLSEENEKFENFSIGIRIDQAPMLFWQENEKHEISNSKPNQ